MSSETQLQKTAETPSGTREVLYRKYRFASFADMCGQEQVSSFFINTIKYSKISHAYLFSGPRGTGKTSMARLFAKILNCTGKTTYEACGKCPNCVEFDNGSAVDIIEMDAASNRKIDDMRKLIEGVSFMPVSGRYKIFILDEAHMLTNEAANAFLKTLEEPPAHVVFILATTEIHKLPATILSRCQLVAFSRISVSDIMKRLEFVVSEENATRGAGEKIEFDRDALMLIAKKAQGGMRDALSLLEYVIALCHGRRIDSSAIEHLLGIHSLRVIREFVESIINASPASGLATIRKVHSAGNEILAFIESLNSYLNSLLLIKMGISDAAMLECDEDDLAGMKTLAGSIEKRKLFRLLEIYSDCLSAIRHVPDQLVHLEFVYVRSIMEYEKQPAETATVPQAAQAAAAQPVRQQPAVDMAAVERLISEKLAAMVPRHSAPADRPAPPREAPAQAPPVQRPSGKLDLEKIRMAWASMFLPQLKSEAIPTHALISSGTLSRYADGVVEIDFTKNAFCGERMMSGSHLAIAEEVFARVTGDPVRFKVILPSQSRAEQAEQRKRDVMEEQKKDPLVQKILQEFDGEIIGVEE